ncbi:MAG TPA: chorismate mutase [Anaerolineales bacterium]|nr:chorismate mutase [Anaerolineales bacterium]
MTIRGIRGATTVIEDKPDLILAATQEMVEIILKRNSGLYTEDIASVLFTTTEDLSSAYPAVAARQMGWGNVPMMCAREIPVTDSLPRCIRVLIHWNTDREQGAIKHVYLREAASLRPDLAMS